MTTENFSSSNLGFAESTNDISESLDGEIYNPEIEKHMSTLDEPVRDTIIRDLKAVGIKFIHVLYPKNNRSLLKNWDLWGPLFLCIIMSIFMEKVEGPKSIGNDGGPEFGQVFILFWVGSAVVTLNSQLLGGDVSFLQTVCVLGYCALPMTLATVACAIIAQAHQTTTLLVAKLIVGMIGFIYSTLSSTAFLHNCNLPDRKLLAIYPIMLFYFFLAWLAVSQVKQ